MSNHHARMFDRANQQPTLAERLREAEERAEASEAGVANLVSALAQQTERAERAEAALAEARKYQYANGEEWMRLDATLARVREALNDAPNTHPAFIVNEIYRALEGGEDD